MKRIFTLPWSGNVEKRSDQPSLPDLIVPNEVVLDLMQAALARNATFRFRAFGWSMSPFIRPGDVIFVDSFRCQKPVVGQVIAFIHPGSGMLLVHRIVQQQKSGFLLQGDNLNAKNDGIIPSKNVIARVVRVTRMGKRVSFGQRTAGLLIASLSYHGLLPPLVSYLHGIVATLRKLRE